MIGQKQSNQSMASILLAVALGIAVPGVAISEELSAPTVSVGQARTIPRGPNEVSARIEADNEPKETTFDFPGIDRALEPWNDWKSRIAEDKGVRLGFDYNFATQGANNEAGEDSATGGIFRAYISWDLWERTDKSRTGTLDIRVENRHRVGTALAPEALAPNFGWAGTTAPDWSNQGWGLPVFMLRQRLDVGDAPIELRVGRMSAFSQFDITPYSDNLTTFQNNSIILSPTIGYPSAGSFGVGGYVGIPRSKLYVLGMIMDANGRYDDLSLETLGDGEYFKALEFGWTDQDLSGLSYLFNNLHIALWHTDDANYGAGLTGSYTFAEQRIGTFGRIAWAKEGAGTLYQKLVSAGFTKGVFRDSMIGMGASWGEVQNTDESQIAAELFYRWQVAQNLAITPSIQFLSNPVFNPAEKSVTVFGVRARVTF